MTPRTDLHQLIHSMTATERRYFRLFSRLQDPGTEWNYLRLFDALLAQEEYDEEAIKKEVFPDSRIAKNLAVEKHYLYDQLLKCLQQFHTRKRKEWQVRERLNGVILLMERELIEPAWNLLKRVKKGAKKYDLPLVALQAHMLETRLLKMRNRKMMAREVVGLEVRGYHLLKRINDEIAMSSIYDRFSVEMHRGFSQRNEKERREVFASFREEPLVISSPQGSSFQTRILRLQMLASMAYRTNDTALAYIRFNEIRALWEEYPERIRAYPLRYLRVLGNCLTGCRDAGEHAMIPAILQRIREFRKKHRLHEGLEVARELQFEMMYFTDMGQLEEAARCGEQLMGRIGEDPEKFPANWLYPAAFNICIVFFLGGQFRQSLRAASFILNLGSTDKWESVLLSVQLLRLMIHFELGNLDLLEYLVRNAGLQFRKKRSGYRFAREVLKMMKDLLKDASPSSQIVVLNRYQHSLKVAEEGWTVGFEEIMYWIGSRISGIPIREIAQSEMRKRSAVRR
jgi:hypothetical protein